jgi:hypothetical protein
VGVGESEVDQGTVVYKGGKTAVKVE